MQKRKLTIEEVEELVRENRYPVNEKHWFLSRCIDGRYERKVQSSKFKVQSLEPLAKPGADIGDLMIVFVANREYDLRIKPEKIFEALLKTVGSWKNLRFQTDEHSKLKVKSEKLKVDYSEFLGCGHFKQATEDPSAYGLVEEEIKAINGFLTKAIKKEAKCEILQGEHLEGAVVMVKGEDWSIAPKLMANNLTIKQFSNETIEVFIYQKTLDNKRRRILAKNLLPYVKTSFSVDEEYLYQILSQVSDNQLLETVNRLAKDLPAYEVEFEEGGEFEIKQL